MQYKAQHPKHVSQLFSFFFLNKHFLSVSQQKFQNNELKLNESKFYIIVMELRLLGEGGWIPFLSANYLLKHFHKISQSQSM